MNVIEKRNVLWYDGKLKGCEFNMESVSRTQNKKQIRTIAGLGVLTAIVVVLQLFASTIRFGPFSISLVNVPVVIGAVLYGIPGGLWLGGVFGAVVLLSGDANLFFAVDVSGTIVTVMVKGLAAGAASAAVSRILASRNPDWAAVAAAFVCPVVNTGMFLLGCRCFFMDTMRSWAANLGFEKVGSYMILGLVGGNFLVELAVSVVLTPVLIRLVRIARKNSGAMGKAE